MIEDVYEPLERYKYEFEQKFAELAEQKFEQLTKRSAIDVDGNRRIASQVKKLKARFAKASRNRSVKLALACILAVCAVLSLVLIAVYKDFLIYEILAVALFGILFYFDYRSYSRTDKFCDALELEIRLKISEAKSMMQPLNKLYTWDISVKLIEKCVPRLKFDPYFTSERLAKLRENFGWSDSFNDNKSVLFAQSGEINGNPFAIGEYLYFHWGMKSYTGYKTITWTSMQRDANGRMRSVRHTQTLSATISKPYPEYDRQKVLIYGNDAAPNLTFLRTPSELSNAGDGLFVKFKKWMRLRSLKSFSRNLNDNSNYTLMSNHEFETLFETRNRNNEVEYRLLFTPLAQRQILKLIKDVKTGFGDDFTFDKQRKINLIYAKHLDKSPIDTNPSRFHNWNYDEAKINFMHFNLEYFKNIYFAFAPLLSIPLYQQTQTRENIYGEKKAEAASFWEHESIANCYGGDYFKSQRCDTQNILKTKLLSRKDGVSEVEVTAHGYEGIQRTEYQTVLGGDLRTHQVPIDWIEYVPVKNKKRIYVSESEQAAEEFKEGSLREGELFRRGIYSFLN